MLIKKINNTIMQYDERGGGGVHKRNRICSQGLVESALHFYLWIFICKSHFLFEHPFLIFEHDSKT